ncbi:MAG: Hsp20/alpha crystallin family protein [Anaerolineales bacterium]
MTFYISTNPYQTAHRWIVNDASPEARSLPVDVRDEDEAYVLTAFVPGLTADELNIQVLDDTVSVEGEYKHDENQYLLTELPSGVFQRALRLPTALDADKAEASIDNGVLTLRLPKAESARPKVIKVAAH